MEKKEVGLEKYSSQSCNPLHEGQISVAPSLDDEYGNKDVKLRKKLPTLPTREMEERRRTCKRKITEKDVWGGLSGDFTKFSSSVHYSTPSNEVGEINEKINEEEPKEAASEEKEIESEKEKENNTEERQYDDENNYYEYYNDEATIEPDGTTAIALWDFKGEFDSDLSFRKGDIISIIRKYDNGWWEGEVNGVIGDFPYNFAVLVSRSDSENEEEEKGVFEEIDSPSHSLRNTSPGISSQLGSENTFDMKKRLTASRVQSSSNLNQTRKLLPIKQGYLLKKGHKRRNWKVRYFVLESSKLTYYANPADAAINKKIKGVITLQKNSLVKLAPEMKRSNCFAIYTDIKPFVMYIAAPTGGDMVSWMESISIARSVGN